MSHYTVLVIGEPLDEALQPFHEFECTGYNDEHIQELDITDETRENYEDSTRKMVVLENGKLDPLYSDTYKVKVEEEGRLFPHTEYRPPAGCEVREVPMKELMSFTEYVTEYDSIDTVAHNQTPNIEGEHQFSYARLDENGNIAKIIRRTNPDARWDWWVLGGRWKGMLKLKAGAQGTEGEPGVFGSESRPGWVDQARKGDIDWDGMRQTHFEEASARYDHFEELAKSPVDSDQLAHKIEWWDNNEYPNKHYPEKPQDEFDTFEDYLEYHWKLKCAQQAKVMSILPSSRKIPSRAQYIGEQCAFTTYAVLDEDGQWHEPDKMGWWGMSHASEEQVDQFQDKFFERFIEPLDDDTLLSVVDCHI